MKNSGNFRISVQNIDCGYSLEPPLLCYFCGQPLSRLLRKHAYSNILRILPPKKNENFQMKNSGSVRISAQNIDCGYSLEPPQRGSSNEYYNLCFWAEIRKLMYTL